MTSEEKKKKFNSEFDRVLALIDKSHKFEMYSASISKLEEKENPGSAYRELLDNSRTLLCNLWLAKCVKYCIENEGLSVSDSWAETVKKIPQMSRKWSRVWKSLVKIYDIKKVAWKSE